MTRLARVVLIIAFLAIAGPAVAQFSFSLMRGVVQMVHAHVIEVTVATCLKARSSSCLATAP